MNDYLAAPERYDSTEYRFTGRSGLKLPALSLGLWQKAEATRESASNSGVSRSAGSVAQVRSSSSR